MADPQRVATLAPAFEHVTLACVLLGSASGTAESLSELHGPRLQMLLARMLDTTVRGVLYEARGTVGEGVLRRGADVVRRACEASRIPYELLEADPSSPGGWVEAATSAAHSLLAEVPASEMGKIRPE